MKHLVKRIRNRQSAALGAALAALALVGSRPADVSAQETTDPAAERIYACYVPASGTVYRIKVAGAKDACASPQHIEFSWNQQGPAGTQGPAGPAGPQGPAGPAGANGSPFSLPCCDSVTINGFALRIRNLGGGAGHFSSTNGNALTAIGEAAGRPSIFARNLGDSPAMQLTNDANPNSPTFRANSNGGGGAIQGFSTGNLPTATIENMGAGTALFLKSRSGAAAASIYNEGGSGPGAFVRSSGQAATIHAENTSAAGTALYAKVNGASAVIAESNGMPTTISAVNLNPEGSAIAGRSVNGSAVIAENTGNRPALAARNTGGASAFVATSSSAPTTINATNLGSGGALAATSTSPSPTGEFVNNGAGSALHAQASEGSAIHVETRGRGFAVHAISFSGTNGLGVFEQRNPSNNYAAVSGETKGGGVGVFGRIDNPASNGPGAVEGWTNGMGPGLRVTQAGAGNDIAIFAANGIHQARIDRNGKGFFNGGTQAGGADLAEAFDVEGDRSAYQPGDVLVISERSDRRVERSTDAYSTRVIGVYATKPGVLLAERDVDADLEDMVPVGVVGVIPTRVTAEGGAIRRGDILVTSGTPGHAMKATPVEVGGVKVYPTGTLIGKALEEFSGPGSGLIRVLVNVK